jgi:hypothetical protein
MDLGKTHHNIKTSIGQIFTPNHVAELMVKNIFKINSLVIDTLSETESNGIYVDINKFKIVLILLSVK